MTESGLARIRAHYSRYRASLVGAIATSVIVVAGGAFFTLIGGPSQDRVVVFFFINLTIVVGLQLFMGNSHVLNFGHIAFMGLGAFTTAVLTLPVGTKETALPNIPFGLGDIELSVLEGTIAALVLVALVALLSGWVLVRIAGISAAIATLALLFIVHTTLVNWEDLTRGSRVLFGIPVETTLATAMVGAVVAIIAARLFRDSPWGVQLRAGGEDPLAAAAMGVNLRRLRLIAWVLGSVLVGVGGVLYAHFLGAIGPDAFFLHVTFLTLAMLLLGGMGSVSGAVAGAVLVTVGFEFMRWVEGSPSVAGVQLPSLLGVSEIFLGLVIVLTMSLRPKGIVGDLELDERLQNWRIERRHLP